MGLFGLVNPARAGMILEHHLNLTDKIGKPRASGDDPTCSNQPNTGGT